MTTTMQTTAAPRLTRVNRYGLILAAVLGLSDIASALAIGAPEDGADGPPMGVIVLSGILAVLTVVTVVWAWRTASRTAVRLTAGTRILSVIASLPALFVDVSAAVKVSVAVFVLLSVTCVVLMLTPERASTRVTD